MPRLSSLPGRREPSRRGVAPHALEVGQNRLHATLVGAVHLRRLAEVALEDAPPEAVAAPIEAEAALINAITVRMAFERLSDDHRDVLSLVDLGGFTYKETADMLGVSIGTVMSRVSRARAQMLCLLDQGNIVALRPRKTGTRK